MRRSCAVADPCHRSQNTTHTACRDCAGIIPPCDWGLQCGRPRHEWRVLLRGHKSQHPSTTVAKSVHAVHPTKPGHAQQPHRSYQQQHLGTMRQCRTPPCCLLPPDQRSAFKATLVSADEAVTSGATLQAARIKDTHWQVWCAHCQDFGINPFLHCQDPISFLQAFGQLCHEGVTSPSKKPV